MNHRPSSSETGLDEYQRLLALLDERRFDEAQVRGRILLEHADTGDLVRAKTHNLLCWTFAEGTKRVSPEAVLHGEEAVRLACQVGERTLEAQALCNLASAQYQVGEWEEARATYNRALCLCRLSPSNLPHGDVLALQGLALVAMAQGQAQESLAHLDSAEALAADDGPFLLPELYRRRVLALLQLNRKQDAAEILSRIDDEALAGGPRNLWWKTHLSFTRARLELAFDHWVTARTLATNTLALARELGDLPVVAEAICLLALVDQAEGRRETYRRARLALTAAIQSGRRDVVRDVRHRLGDLINTGL